MRRKRSVAAVSLVMALAMPATTARAGQDLYIPLGDEGAVLVIDTGRDTVGRRIEGLPAVHGLAATPDGRVLVAGSFDERPVGGVLPPKPAGVSAEDHAAHHGGGASKPSLAVVISTVSIVDAGKGVVVRRIDVPGAVHHVAVSPDGGVAVVTHPNQGTVTAIDLARSRVLATVATGPLPNYAAFAPDGGQVYVSNAGNATVSEVDTRRWFVRRNIVVGSGPEHLVLSGDGRTLYVNNVDDGTVSVVSLDRGEAASTLQVGSTPHGLDLSADGRTLFVSALGDDRLVAIDLPSGELRSVPLPAPYHLAVVGGAGRLYVASADEPKVWVVEPNDLTVVAEIAIGGTGHQMARAARR